MGLNTSAFFAAIALSFACSSSPAEGGSAAGASGAAIGGGAGSGGQAPGGSSAGAGGQAQGSSATGGSAGSSSGGASSAGSSGKGGASESGGLGGASTAAGAGAGGGGGSGGSGGSGGTAPYNPCPSNGDPCRIMPLGDSITEGYGTLDGAGWRPPLFQLSLMHQQNITFVGSLQNGPDTVDSVPFPKNNEGHGGYTIDDSGGWLGLYPHIQTWLTTTPPDIVLLMIGTNDVQGSLDLANAPTRLGLLLDRIATYAPSALIVVAQPIPTVDDALNQKVMTYGAAIPGVVKTRTDAGKHIITVDMYRAFSRNANFKTEYYHDKVHPNDAGYLVMTTTWYDAVGSLLPAK
jgi:lysophospholipase L1-like esterase